LEERNRTRGVVEERSFIWSGEICELLRKVLKDPKSPRVKESPKKKEGFCIASVKHCLAFEEDEVKADRERVGWGG
jgi:hypothetical protein